MGKQWVWAGVSSLFLAAGSAQAGFDFNYTVTPGTGALSGNNIFKFYAKNDQSGDQIGSKTLLVFDIHIKPLSQSLLFDVSTDVDGDGNPDVNVAGKGMDENNVTGTFLRVGTYDNFAIAVTSPKPYNSAGGANPIAAYTNVTDFNLVGLVLGPANAPDATQGLGAFYGAAVVPTGVDVNVAGMVAAEVGGIVGTPSALPADVPAGAPAGQGPDFFFNFVAQAPEPGSLTVLGIGGVGLISRRRRR
jgi:hypothetical protein